MKTLLKLLALLLALLVAIALLVPMFISMDDITQTIADQVEATTGRTLAVDGEKSLTVFPSLALQLEQVRFSNSAGGSRPDMATIESLDIHIPWLSLLSGELKVKKFVINNPDILLEIDATGNANWDIMPTAEPAPDSREGEAPSLPAGFDISLDEVAIYGGRVRLLNHQAGSEQLVEELDLGFCREVVDGPGHHDPALRDHHAEPCVRSGSRRGVGDARQVSRAETGVDQAVRVEVHDVRLPVR